MPSGTHNCELTYYPDKEFYGSDMIQVCAKDTDGNEACDTVSIMVTPVNDPPVLISSDMFQVLQDCEEDGTLTLSGYQVFDVDAVLGSTIYELSMSIPDAYIVIEADLSLFKSGSYNSSSIVLRGDLSDIQAAINSFMIAPDPDFNGIVHLNLALTEVGVVHEKP